MVFLINRKFIFDYERKTKKETISRLDKKNNHFTKSLRYLFYYNTMIYIQDWKKIRWRVLWFRFVPLFFNSTDRNISHRWWGPKSSRVYEGKRASSQISLSGRRRRRRELFLFSVFETMLYFIVRVYRRRRRQLKPIWIQQY